MVRTCRIPTHITHIVGIDEAGRGSIAGPVAVGIVSAAVSGKRLFPNSIPDSKQLTPRGREEWFRRLSDMRQAGSIEYAYCRAASRTIDRIGIVPALRHAITRGLRRMHIEPDRTLILLDGALSAPPVFSNQKTIIRGDEQEPIIALASIVAKVLRDRTMVRLAKTFPEYDFDVHKGYGTRAHYKNLNSYGLSPIHRQTFLSKWVLPR